MSNNYGPRIVTDGLICCLDAADRNSYAGSGSTWYDLSGNGRNFTMIGSVSHNGLYFDGFNDSNYWRGSSYSHGSNGFTYSIWIKYNTIRAGNSLFDNGVWTDTLLYRYQTGNIVAVYAESALRGTYSIELGSGSYPITKWYNFVFTRANETGYPASMYIDGNFLSSFTMNTSINITQPNLALMRSQHSTDEYTNGKLAIFQMYSRPLLPDEVRQNFEATKGRFGL